MSDDATEHDEARHEQRVAVAALRPDEARETDRAGGAGNVLDDRRFDDARLLHRQLHRARRLIPAAAGSRWSHDAQLLVEGLREGGRPRE